LGCAATQTHESTGEYVDDSVLTTKVKAAILDEATLKTLQIDVQTFKGVVQLSGFVDSAEHVATDGPLERLRVRQQQNFDRAFILAMVREHGKMIDALTSTMQESRDTDLRRLLAGQLPVLQRLKKTGEAILARLPANSEN
jgi:hemerythrin-like domain-containing protein